VRPLAPGHKPKEPWYRRTTQGYPEGYGRKGVTVSSGLSLAFMVIGLLAVIFAFGVVWRRTASTPRDAGQLTQADRDQVTQEADHIRARAETEATGILERAREEAEQAAQGRREVEEEIRAVKDEVRELRGDLERRETRLADREQRLDAELKRIEDRTQALDQRRQDLDRRAAELGRQDAERAKELERVAGLTSDQAKIELVTTIENQAKREAALIVRDIEHEAKSEGEKRARKIVTLAIQRVATEQTSESVVSVLHLPGDEMKGRIIGREGRNIRAFESVTGVNLIIDDTPEAVLLSCFDPVRGRSRGSPWNGSSWTAGSTRSGSRTPTSAARRRSSSCASGPARTPWSSSASPTCTPNSSISSAA
jgi:ribonuclease Y